MAPDAKNCEAEVEVTPEMIEAGAKIVASIEDSRVTVYSRQIAEEVFRAMISLAPR